MSLDLDQKRLLQRDTLERLSRKIEMTEMIPVYLFDNEGGHEYAIYGVLVPSNHTEQVLSNPADWDLGFSDRVSKTVGVEQTKFLSYDFRDTLVPLVITRNFHESKTNFGKRAPYQEICEEFRLFHNLYHDCEKGEYLKIDDEGNEELVATIEPHCIEINLGAIRQFLAVKETHLSVQFRHYEFSRYSLEEIGAHHAEIKTGRETTVYGDICWQHSYWDYHSVDDEHQSFSVLEGKRLIEPLPKSQISLREVAGESREKYLEFIIGVNDNGEEISHTCDPAKIDRYGSNPGAPIDITPIHFRKQVLDKYYHEPDKYEIGESLIKCPWWSMQIDNHHNDKVIVLLRHLSSLPYTEQLHWQSENVLPEGGVSKTYFERNFKGLFTESDRPEHVFKQSYRDLQTTSEKCLGWQFLLPLPPRDEHYLKSLRIPSTDEQRDFDELVLSLAKILIDSLNQKQLKKLISSKQEENLNPEERERLKQGIGCLEIALNACGVGDAEVHISFLRKLQSLRSTGTAHLKGKNYQKIAKKFGIGSQSLRSVFAGILWQAVDVLDFFIFLLRSEQINPKIIEENSSDRGYTILGEMVGIAESDSTDGSVNHDEVIYELDSKP